MDVIQDIKLRQKEWSASEEYAGWLAGMLISTIVSVLIYFSYELGALHQQQEAIKAGVAEIREIKTEKIFFYKKGQE